MVVKNNHPLYNGIIHMAAFWIFINVFVFSLDVLWTWVPHCEMLSSVNLFYMPREKRSCGKVRCLIQECYPYCEMTRHMWYTLHKTPRLRIWLVVKLQGIHRHPSWIESHNITMQTENVKRYPILVHCLAMNPYCIRSWQMLCKLCFTSNSIDCQKDAHVCTKSPN